MFEFRIHSQQKKNSHSTINLTNNKVNAKNSIGVYSPQVQPVMNKPFKIIPVEDDRSIRVPPTKSHNILASKHHSPVNFKNMQANLKNAKRGCRSCNGTF